MSLISFLNDHLVSDYHLFVLCGGRLEVDQVWERGQPRDNHQLLDLLQLLCKISGDEPIGWQAGLVSAVLRKVKAASMDNWLHTLGSSSLHNVGEDAGGRLLAQQNSVMPCGV